MGKNKARVTIDGRTIVLTGAESAEYISQVASYIDRLLREVRRSPSASELDNGMIMLMTVINVGDELFKEKEKNQRLEKELSRTKELLVSRGMNDDNSAMKKEAEALKKEIVRLEKELSRFEQNERSSYQDIVKSFDAEKQKYFTENQRLMVMLNELKEKNKRQEEVIAEMISKKNGDDNKNA